MPFELQPWHVYTCMCTSLLIISVFICLSMVLMLQISPDYKIHLYEKQMFEQEAMFKKQMQEREAMFKKQMHEQEAKLEEQRAMTHEKEVKLEAVERQLVTSKQMHLIDTFKQGINEARSLKDHHIANLREYSFLKEKRDSWLDWGLSYEQNARINQLEGDYVDIGETLDVNAAMDIVRRDCEKMVTYFSSQLEVLEDALDEMDMEKMKQSQKDIKNQHVHIPSFFQMQTEHIKSNIRISSHGHALQIRGRLEKVAALFYNLFKIVFSNLAS